MILLKKNLTFFIFILLGIQILNSQVIANFSADTLSGCSPVYVTFKNLSTPTSEVSYFWDFGNGVTSNLKNPANIYITSGKFNVKLIVSDGIFSDTIIKNDYINIYKPPKANMFFSGKSEGCLPFTKNFSDASIIGDASIKYFLWNFGDGTYSETQNPVHTFTDKGTFQISFYILDENDCSDYVYSDSLIKTNEITADFSVDNTFSCNDSISVNFQNLSTGDSIVEYYWNFGNGQTSNDQNPTYIYTDTGKFTVSLIIKDQFNCTDTAKKENLISNQHVKAFFYVPNRVSCPNTSTIFINQSKNADIFHWYFGDEKMSSEDSVIHKYSHGGIYSAKLIASNYFGCSDSLSRNIFVDSVTAKFITDKNFICSLPDTIQYTNQSINASNFLWLFANGDTSFAKNPTNIITHEGTWSDTLIATNINGCSDKYIFKNGINSTIPKAYFIPNNLVKPFDIMGCVPNTVKFTDVSNYETTTDSIISWFWDFDDGQTSTLKNPNHTFTTLDTFFVTLKTTTLLGCSSQYGAWAYTGTRQQADFSVLIPDTICASDPVAFTNLSQDENLVNLNYWEFSDSTYSLDDNPIHYFQDTGYASVTLYAYYNGCPDSMKMENITYINGPYHEITEEYNCLNRFSPTLHGNIKSATKFYWDFVDGSDLDSLNENPQHIFPARNSYKIKLYSENSNTGCSLSSEKEIKIFSAKANFIVEDTTLCLGQTLNLNSGSSIDEHIFIANDSNVVYLYNFGENLVDVLSIDSVISYKYSNEGNFKIKLKIKDAHQCFDSVEQTIYVHKPHSSFSSDKTSGCTPLLVNFTNTSSSYFPINTSKWIFGNGNNSSSTNPSNLYTYKGNFDVSLISIDNENCIDTLKNINYISTGGPIPNFSANKTKICLGDNITFTYSTQTEDISDVLWDFGDGNTSHEKSPVHNYSSSGNYSVSLTLFSSSGCDSTKIISDYISVQDFPISDFYSDTSSSNCYPLIVHFFDNSTSSDINSYTWNLGNNIISHVKNPSFAYLQPGDFDISLTVKTSNGCLNTNVKNNFISIKGPYAKIIAHDTICKNINTDFKIKDQKNIAYLRWFFGEGGTSNDTFPFYNYKNPGYFNTILLLKSDSSGQCTKYLINPILVRDIKSGFIVDSISKACPPFELSVTDTTANSFLRTWDFGDSFSDNSITAYHTYKNQGNINITLYEQDSYGCLDTNNTTLTVNPLPVLSIINDTFICKGNDIQLFASGTNKFSWTPTTFLNNPLINNPISSPDSTIIYTLKGTSSNGCSNYASTKISVIQIPKFNINDTSIVIGDTILLNNSSKDIAIYSWTPTNGLSCSECDSVFASPLESTFYTLTISDTANCFEISKTIYIDVALKYSLDVPTAFTPNGDGINDIIYVDGWGIQELLYFNIYNRYGELVFSTNKIYQGWDGNYKNRPQPIETYRYNVAVKSYDGSTKTKSGTIKLLR